MGTGDRERRTEFEVPVLCSLGTQVAVRVREPGFHAGTKCLTRMGCFMDTMVVLFIVWGLITILFLALVFYRSRLTKNETDWIPLSDDAKEEHAIEAQKVIEMKTNKVTIPIRALGAAWVVMALVIVGFWLYHGITTPPPIAK